jgi:hypothetical protein
MTKREFLSVGLKIIGLILIFAIVCLLPYFVSGALNVSSLRILFIIFILIFLGGIYFLLRGSDKIAIKLIPVDKKLMVTGIDNFPKELFVLVLRIQGVFNILEAVSYLTRSFLIQAKHVDWTEIAIYILVIIGSVYLCTGAKYVTEFAFKNFRIDSNQSTGIKQSETKGC